MPLVRSVVHAQRGHGVGEGAGEPVGHGVVDVEAVGGGARLSAVAHLRDHRAGDRLIDVRILQHDERVVAAFPPLSNPRMGRDGLASAAQRTSALPGRPGVVEGRSTMTNADRCGQLGSRSGR
jgi:hypothetical protein